MPTYLVKIKDKLFENIFDNAPNGIAIVGLDFRWVKINRSLMDLLEYSENEFYAMTFPDITHKDDVDADIEQLGQLLRKEIASYQIEKRYFTKKGKIIWVVLSVSLEVNEEGSPLYFISQIMDITKHRELVFEMNTITDIAKNQNNKLKNFAHIATHDIRSHLGNLSMIAGFMEEEVKGIKDDDNFIMLKEALSQLENTIYNLNEFRDDGFQAQENLVSLNLSDFVERALYNVNGLARHAKCEIVNDVSQTVNVLAIPVYLDSVILNLMTNAIKYASKNRNSYVQLRTIMFDEFVILEVNDNGIGIDLTTYRHDVFQFKRTFNDHEDSRGIGLFITKNHVESMGGKIEVESEVDVGSTFRVFLKKA